MNVANNTALIELSKVWVLDGDLLKCRACKKRLVASRDGEPLRHEDGCKYYHRVHPWQDLRNAMAKT